MMLNLKHLLVMMFVLLSVNLMAQTSISSTGVEYSRNGNTFSSVTKSKQSPELTPYTWKDTKGNEYPIYISSSGSCFIIKENGNKQYMKKEISMQICSEMNKEYKNKKK
jgi:hypothetical protein